ncbi:MAG: hypothetical protein U2P59_09675 [Synergistota bacterium]|nr:hypothetical protein [Synergistota bacterium]
MTLLLIFLFAESPATAFEKAAPMDFIFKGGDYRERITMVIEAPITARIEGPEGSHFYIDFTGRTELQNTQTDDNGIETYSAIPEAVSIRSDRDDIDLRQFSAGLIYEPVTSSLAWLLHSSGPGHPEKKWTKELSDHEYQFIGFQTTITADVGTNAILVQYAGSVSGSNEILLEITDADAPDTLTRKVIYPTEIPGYFQMPGGGILGIDRIEAEEGIPMLHYEWTKEPPL